MSSRAFSRRLFLRGAFGITVGIPLLGATTSFAQTAPRAKRFIVVFEHGGTISNTGRASWRETGSGAHHGWDDWAPAQRTESLVLGPIHQPLAAFRDSLLVLKGIDNIACVRQQQYKGGHRSSNVTALTCGKYTELDPDTFVVDRPSLDRVLATRLAAASPVPFESVHFTTRGASYGTPFMRGANQPVNGEQDPVRAFESLFKTTTSSQPDPALVALRAQRRSILDSVMGGIAQLRGRVGAEDRLVLDAHFEFLRELELRIQQLASAPVCAPPSATSTLSPSVAGPLFADMIVAALRCGLTHVATLEIGDLITPWLGSAFGPVAFDSGHSLHHDASTVGATGTNYARRDLWRQDMQANRKWRMGLLARILDGLAKTPEGGGTMLDNSLLLCTSEFSAGAIHSVSDLPILLAGKAGGALRTGRFLNYEIPKTSLSQYESRTSTHNLYTSILNAFGYPDTHFGNDDVFFKGPLSGLT